jgi:betaine-aldehyde dehydrogenase
VTQTAPHALNWIDGTWVDTPDVRNSVDPATGERIGTWACAGPAETASAIAAAASAFANGPWKDDRHLRSRALMRLAELFESNADELVSLLMHENGKIGGEARFEVGMVAPKLRYWAAMALTDHGRASVPTPGRISMVLREPVGVVGIIVPFNSPVILAVRALGPALAAGNAVVVKFPEQTAQVNTAFMRVLASCADIPAGVVNAITSDVDGASEIVTSPRVPAISFTGSTRTGRAIAAAGADRLKRFSLELGGKTPVILFDSCDLDAALPTVVKAVTTFAGQFCMTGSRLLVQAGIADEVRTRLAERLGGVRVGPAADPESDMGPLIDEANVERVDAMVEEAIAAGASVVVRGGPVTDGPLATGAFYRPTVVETQDRKLRIVQEEVFGPVVTLTVFETEEEAVEHANDSEYGLAASVWSRDLDQPLRVAQALQSGTVWINDWAAVFDEAEEGGYKQSGLGRLNGIAALEDFTEYKHVAIRTGGGGH